MNRSVHRNILLIDDEEEFRSVISKSLSKHGFDVLEASDGADGLRSAAANLPDLILCDLSMPQMTGYQVLAALRRDEKLADIPVIFLTSQSEPAEVRQGMNLGVDDYLTKPASILDLLGAIKARLDRRQSERLRQDKQMDRAMQLFAETVHDLRNPLFAVFGFTNLLRLEAGQSGQRPERAEQIFTRMQQAVTRMQDIISETMFVVRSRMKPQPLNPAAFDLRDFCELLVADYDPNGRLKFHHGGGRFPIVAEAPRLRHALENLLSNALKYSDGPVGVCLTRLAQGYRIEVTDQGIGIPVKDQGGIFEPFFRASNTGARTGHGLGLCVVQSCIEQHSGAVRFVSKPAEGTTFSIDLPASPPNCVESQARAELVRLPAGKLPEPPGNHGADGSSPVSSMHLRSSFAEHVAHKLGDPLPLKMPVETEIRTPNTDSEVVSKLKAIVVEDDPVVRSVMRELLASSNDVQVVGEASTVAQARRLTSQHAPGVVFLDVNLPDGSGFDLLPYLAEKVSVVFVTSAEEYAAQAFDCDAADYLVKPVSFERLQKALQRVRQRLTGKNPAASLGDTGLTGSFLVKTLTERRVVKFCEIKSILAYGEYSWVYWDKCKKGALLRKSLKKWQTELPEAQFVRVHRRAIVNLAFLDRVERLPAGRLQIHLREITDPILVSLSQTPTVNRQLKALRD